MGTFEFLMIIVILTCAVLVLVILSQNPKGGGLSSSFGGSGGGQMFGVQRTNQFLDKATWTLSCMIAALIIIASVVKENPKSTQNEIPPAATIQEVPNEAVDAETMPVEGGTPQNEE